MDDVTLLSLFPWQVDMVFVSWVIQPEMVTAVREALGDAKDRMMVVAKIESYNSVKRSGVRGFPRH